MSSPFLLQSLCVGPIQVNCFLVACPDTSEAMVIDPGEEGERIMVAVEAEGYKVTQVVNTHGHFDHIGANRYLVEQTNAPLSIHPADVPLLKNAQSHASTFGLTAVLSPERSSAPLS